MAQSVEARRDHGFSVARSRHTWASWHVQMSTPLHVLQELGAWETADMVRRYAHLTSEHLAPYVKRFSQLRVVHPEENVTNTLRAVS